ncbi:hypothetical protein D3OALGB2SA_645 [Olavius algarvensis associated proteobacterium Delta 3]|nr:hypothetical protein D3OALGB2SA_645 [Olavius algarvensis associated proteobacterium Delta 3]
MRVISLALAAVMLSVSLAWTGDINSVRDLPDELKNPRKGRLSLSDITLFDIRIGRETLDDVRSLFGKTRTFREPPKSVSAAKELCYASSNPADETCVIFGSGPMGGWSNITTFQVLSRASQELPCTPAPGISRAVATQSGIRLGMPVMELRSKFGHPSDQGQGFVIFSFEQKSDHPKRKDFHMLSGVMATFANRRITSFKVFLIESK